MAPPSLTDGAAVGQLTSVRSILMAAAPAIANNAATPLSAALQLGLLGHTEDAANQVAVFSAIGSATTFIANIANFVIVVTMARVGHALGSKQWALIGRTVRVVLLVAAVVGCVSALLLWLGCKPVLVALSLSKDTSLEKIAKAYLPVAVARLPSLLVLKAASAVLVGYQCVRTASALNGLLACVDTLAFYIVLHVYDGNLLALGTTVAATCACAAILGLISVGLLRPHASVRVFNTCEFLWPSKDPSHLEPRPPALASPLAENSVAPSAGGSASMPTSSTLSLLSLACDSLNVLIRSIFLSGSVLAMTLAVAPLGAAALGAHAVVMQLWMVTSYIVDGFADVGTMMGSRLLGAGESRAMRPLTKVLACLGLFTGVLAGILLWGLRSHLITAFTSHVATRGLLDGPLWLLLCVLQPVNALVFVYDGLLYAVRAFRFVRNALVFGVLLSFAPGLVAAKVIAPSSLIAIWIAKAALNACRCASALIYIHAVEWPHWVKSPTDQPRPSHTGLLAAALGVTPLNAVRQLSRGSDGHGSMMHVAGADVTEDRLPRAQ